MPILFDGNILNVASMAGIKSVSPVIMMAVS